MNETERRQVNDESLRQFFSQWDTDWRWLLLLGLRDLRRSTKQLGGAAAATTGAGDWADDEYLFGPVALGVTAAAVNEAAQYCEDLFALLKFLREPTHFVRKMMSYSAGQVVNFGHSLGKLTDEKLRRMYLVPDAARIVAGISGAVEPVEDARRAQEGVERLTAMTREIVEWHETYEPFHLQYKHGLKVALRPFGKPTSEAIAERKASVRAPLFMFSNDSAAQVATRPPDQQVLAINISSAVMQKNLTELDRDRSLLTLRFGGPEVDLDRIVAIGRTVLQLLRVAKHNRLMVAEGLDTNGQQRFVLPAQRDGWGQLELSLSLQQPLILGDFL
jgi:hypothetical protein